ncbi:MAG: HIT family protein [Candidatus Magasanikbacteria bacterium]|jgi:histidine triad (HIT) family protein|nr:HIT family protein [Candidatus Magasanikbacteria bacterium]MBT4221057.1 HIT family protein [Candidatus Magasanikbacteria bacterium]MBT4350599.1 HIT family protein [Candidatus Magasanikbacteria bacterium]MBT4542102.1 HIT family protein [Candidatus Magasanikbacteria bacterium]MBT6253224.1 HIT family protein [Candidatus Magasanikbacteria bacterium]
MDACIFCKILKKEIPNYTVYEDEHVLAFLDIFPMTKGHTVVIPKVHGETICDLEDHVLEKLMVGVKNTTKKIQDALNPDGFNIGWNHHEVAGQSVPHVHVHIIPRFNGDGGKGLHGIIKKDSDTPVEELAKKFI